VTNNGRKEKKGEFRQKKKKENLERKNCVTKGIKSKRSGAGASLGERIRYMNRA